MYETVKVIRLSDLKDVEDFVRAAGDCDFDIDVKYNRTLIDAKSLIGMIGLGFMKDIQVCYGGRNEKFERVVDKYRVAV
ncbi:MAG: HPr family phosphocarrier protein [Lachnospiraceae bacterium]|nr:HPr family phosphocarrier protein [Lachnospiraceae bacterium]